MVKFKRYIIAGWFDLMGIETGVNYMRFNQTVCSLPTYELHKK